MVAQMTSPAALTSEASLEERCVRRVFRRIVPFLAVLYVINFLDRTNVGFAALTMNSDIGISPGLYTIGAGIFFFGYFVFEIPSNVLLHKFGPRMWIARIMVSWGLIACAMGFLQNSVHFIALRVLLGVAEAGFFPGVIYLLGMWIPRRYLARTIASFYLGVPISQVIGAPLSTGLIALGGHFHVPGWRLMFVCEGLPAILLGVACLLYLTDTPAEAKWLAEDERAWLMEKLAAEERAKAETSGPEVSKGEQVRRALSSPVVWALAWIYFGITCASNSLNYLLPSVLQSFRETFGLQIGLIMNGFITAIPYAAAAVTMLIVTRRSDRFQERRWHTGLASLIAAVAIWSSLLVNNPYVIIVGFVIMAMGAYSAINVFWSIPQQVLSGLEAAAGIALINAIGNLSGFFGPYISGFIYAWTHTLTTGFFVIGAIAALGGVGILLLPKRLVDRAKPSPAAQQLS
jgi:ACS family tartrate transporter-like MFS transporter